jgi:glycosyltransferase involved in cell wall biosynthesis/ubiquinone/menaquinone biosynthesis C-methylase UbiE
MDRNILKYIKFIEFMSPYVQNSIEKNLEMVACPFCGSREADKYSFAADIVKCRNCETIYLRTRLTRQALDALYQSYADDGSHMALPKSQEDIYKNPLRREWFLEEMLEYIDPKGDLLDVGCGWGAFIHYAKEKGFDVMGIEITQKTADFAMRELDLEVYNVPFSELDFENDTFSAVTMIHSLEHLPNAKSNIDKVFSILREGGLFAGIVPNIESYGSTHLKEQWEWIDPYHHLIHFSPEVLKKHLLNAGFTIEKIYTAIGDYNKEVIVDVIKDKENIHDQNDILSRIKEIETEGKGEEIRFFVTKKLNKKNGTEKKEEPPKEHITPEHSNDKKDEEIIKIELHEGDDHQKMLFDIFARLDGPKKIIIEDIDNILPDYADNWNGIEVIRNKESFAETEIDEVTTEILEENEIDSNEEAEPLPEIDIDEDIPLKLNLGCGSDIRESYQNIDLFVVGDDIIKMDALELEYADNEVDEILAKDLLQYLPMNETELALQEWARVLKPGGLLELECSSLKLLTKAMTEEDWDIDDAAHIFYGRQSHPGDYVLNAFDSEKIKTHLENAGMQVVAINEDVMEKMGLKRYSITATAKIPELRRETEKENHVEVSGQMGDEKTKGDEIDEQSNKVNTYKEKSMEQFAGFDFSGEIFNTGPEKEEKDIINIDDIEKELNIVWEGSQFVYHSLALINREHCSNIIDTGLAELHIIPYEKDTFTPEGNEKYEKLLKQDIRYKEDAANEVKKLPYLWVRHQWPPDPEPPKGAKWVIMQPWEFSQLRKDFVDIFSQADEIWTPSNYSRKCIVSSGVEFSKVQVVPNGIDPVIATPKGDKYQLQTKKRFKLLYVGGTIYRKGFDLLLKAYLSSFTAEHDICLVVKDMGGDSFYKGMTAKEQIENARTNSDYPEIEYIDNTLNENEIFDLYRACDVFVSPYRGEGFSLPTLEAMACGLPVVVTAGGATDDFCDEEVAWLIPSSRVSIGSNLNDKALTGEAYLLEPDFEVLTDTLKSIFINPGEIIKTGINAQYRARTKWTWKKATLKLFSRIDALYGKQLSRKAEHILHDQIDDFVILGEAEEEYNNNNNERAAELFEEAIKSNYLTEKYRIHSLHRLAILNIEFGEHETAEEYLDQVSIIYPDHPDTLYIRSILKEEQDDLVGALEDRSPLLDNWVNDKFISSIGINLDTILNDTAENFYHQGDLENALKLFSEALKMNNTNAYSCLGAARCFADGGVIDEAINMYEWALKLDPDLEEALEELDRIKVEGNE